MDTYRVAWRPTYVCSYRRSATGELGDRGVLGDRLGRLLHPVAELLRVAALEHQVVDRTARLVVELLVPGVEQVTHEDVLAGLGDRVVGAGQAGRDGDTVGGARHHGKRLGELGEAQRRLLG